MSERLYPENRDTFKAYQEGTLDGIRSIIHGFALIPDEEMVPASAFKKMLNDALSILEFERDEWERKYGL